MSMENLNKFDIYWIGGSPCSGKSTVVDLLREKYGFDDFRCDSYMYAHMGKADPDNQPIMSKLSRMSWDEIWMRPVELLIEEELAFYHEEFPMLLEEIERNKDGKPLLVEGNALLPDLLEAAGIDHQRIIYLIPSRDFQVSHYAKRAWKEEILKDCVSPEQAIQNWMDRDAGFGDKVFGRAVELDIRAIRVHAGLPLEEVAKTVENHFGLSL